MTWTRMLIVLLFCFTSCTIKVEPLPKKPVKQYNSVKHHTAHPHRTPTPTPVPMPHKKELELEPTQTPTPIIGLPNTTWIRSIHPMDMYLG